MRNQRKLQILLLFIVLLSVSVIGSSWTVYAQQPDDSPCPETDTTSTPDTANNSADENCDAEQNMQDMSMDNSDVMQRMVRHCEMMAMIMRMMMGSDGTEQDMQGMMGGSDSMGESTDGDANPEPDMMSDFHMMNMMMQMMMDGTASEDTTPEPDMHGMGEGN